MIHSLEAYYSILASLGRMLQSLMKPVSFPGVEDLGGSLVPEELMIMRAFSKHLASNGVVRTMTAAMMAMVSVSVGARITALTFSAPNGQTIAVESTLASCVQGAQIMPFLDDLVQVDGVRFQFNPQPPVSFSGGAAVAALYQIGTNAQGEPMGQFCVDGTCLANGNTCSAIAFVQPNGVRIYSRQ